MQGLGLSSDSLGEVLPNKEYKVICLNHTHIRNLIRGVPLGALNEAIGDGRGLGLEVKVQGLGGPEH